LYILAASVVLIDFVLGWSYVHKATYIGQNKAYQNRGTSDVYLVKCGNVQEKKG